MIKRDRAILRLVPTLNPRRQENSFAPPCRRTGLTLFEILLVLALLVVISAVTMPLLSESLSRARLQNSGELVRAAWGKARLAAMQAGEPYVFRYEPKGSRYQIVLLSATIADEVGEVNVIPPEDEAAAEYAEADMLRLAKNRLPEGIVFSAGETSSAPQMTATAQGSAGGWSSPIMFYSDGTTADATVLVANASGETIRITLRGLTGISRASEIGSEVAP